MEKSIENFVKENNIKLHWHRADFNPNMDDFGGDHYKVVLFDGKKQMTVYYSKGYGHHGAEPTAEEVLDCLASDASGYDNSPDFEEWAAEYGYDTDSRKAEKTFKIIERQTKRLENFLGQEKYQELLFETERL